jgi:YXWGXW repeat-containing protein
MNRMRHTLLPALALALAGCYVTSEAVSPYPPVPAARAEVMPKPPVSAEPLIWQPGHWDWDGRGYVWAPGQWVGRAGHGAMWQDGYWTLHNGGWAWVPAHWV